MAALIEEDLSVVMTVILSFPTSRSSRTFSAKHSVKKRIMLAAVFRIHDFFWGKDPDQEHWLAGKKSFFPLENTSILLGISSE
jgi:hypothetical protein